MKLAYYPGCSSRSTAAEYNESVEFTARSLGVELEEIVNWNCCGASSGHVVDRELGLALPGRNQALAEKMALDIVTSCPSCFLRHKRLAHELRQKPALKARIEDYIGMPLTLSQTTRHILEVLYHDVGLHSLQQKVKRPLKKIRAVMYYGCYLVRPPEITQFDDADNPTLMDRIMETIGIEVVDWSCKVDCCGGGLLLTRPEIAKILGCKITNVACELGADAIITACNLCHANLDICQERQNRAIPIFYFSELTALALGHTGSAKWFEKHMVNPGTLLERSLSP